MSWLINLVVIVVVLSGILLISAKYGIIPPAYLQQIYDWQHINNCTNAVTSSTNLVQLRNSDIGIRLQNVTVFGNESLAMIRNWTRENLKYPGFYDCADYAVCNDIQAGYDPKIGVVVYVTFTATNASGAHKISTEQLPVFCSVNGRLLPNSKQFLVYDVP
ncbi:Uncharacterised protein [uncultured archaeon]|nr:Uncharacterised protein [uncultured archaeon]